MHRPLARRGRGRRGFTLVELFVVISVIAVLVMLLFPALRSALWSSKARSTQAILAQVGVAIELFSDMRGHYPTGTYGTESFCNRALVEQLGSLLKVRQTCFIDTNGDGQLDAVADAWARPFLYTRYVATAANLTPGASNGEDGVQPVKNPKTFDLFSCGAFIGRVMSWGGWDSYQTNALGNNGLQYNYDNRQLTDAGGKPTGEVNRYYGNW